VHQLELKKITFRKLGFLPSSGYEADPASETSVLFHVLGHGQCPKMEAVSVNDFILFVSPTLIVKYLLPNN
jgi:hypothetical protein